MKKNGLRTILALALAAAMLQGGAALGAADAYIDWDAGIITATGRGAPQTDFNERAARESARTAAFFDAQRKLESVILGAGVPEGGAVRDLLARKPSFQIELDRFIQGANVANETEAPDRTYSVTLQLPARGANGLEGLIEHIQGKSTWAPGMIPTGVSPAVSAEPQSGIRRIGILPLEDETAEDLGVAARANEQLVELIESNYHYKIVDAGELDAALEQAGLTPGQLRGFVPDRGEWRPLGELDGVVMGAVIRYEKRTKAYGTYGAGYVDAKVNTQIRYRIIDAQTGRLLGNDTIHADAGAKIVGIRAAEEADGRMLFDEPGNPEGFGAKSITEAAARLAAAVRAAFPIEGVVLKASGGFAFISLTRIDGVEVGARLDVYRLGDMLTFPDGKQVGRIRDHIGVLEVVEVQPDYSKCRIREERSGRIAAGDLVVLR